MRPELRILVCDAEKRILDGEDFLETYLNLMENVAQSGADRSEIAEIVDRWAKRFNEHVEKIYPQYKNLKLASKDEYRVDSNEDKERIIRELFIHKLIDEYKRQKSSKSIGEWITIIIGLTFIVLLVLYGDKLYDLPHWIIIICIFLSPVFMLIGIFIFGAQISIYMKIERLCNRLTRGKMKDKVENFLLFCIFFVLPGIFISIDEKSIFPLLLCIALGLFVCGIYGIVLFIKKWRSKRRFSRLSLDTKATLFKDFTNQAKWDPEASRALRELLDRKKK